MEEFGAVSKSPWGQPYGLGQGQTLTELWWAGAMQCGLVTWVAAVTSEQVFGVHNPGISAWPGARVSPVGH